MSEIKQQVNTFMVNYFCDDCKKGYMVFTGKQRPAAVKRGVFYLIHKCSNCGKIKEFENKKYPYQMYVVISKDNVELSNKSD
jgi:RNase P subunit RPR2